MDYFKAFWACFPLLFCWQLLRVVLLTRCLRQVDTQVLGRIVRLREQTTRHGTRLVPTARFSTHLGQVLEGESQGFLTNLSFATGDGVPLRYDPDQPARFLFEKELAGPGTYLLAGATGILGLGALLSALSPLLNRLLV